MLYEFLVPIIEDFDVLNERIIQTSMSDKTYPGTFNNVRHSRVSKDELGRGAFSKVTPDHNDPHLVKKTNITPLGKQHADKADGFEQFVRLIDESGMNENIHFPRIYRATKVTDAQGTHRSSYSMEKLEPIKSLSFEDSKTLEQTHMTEGYSEDASLSDRLYDACRSPSARERYVKMESLKEACEALYEMDDVSDFRLDIHKDNIMVRRTPYGVQLVFSNPFGLVKDYWAHKYN